MTRCCHFSASLWLVGESRIHYVGIRKRLLMLIVWCLTFAVWRKPFRFSCLLVILLYVCNFSLSLKLNPRHSSAGFIADQPTMHRNFSPTCWPMARTDHEPPARPMHLSSNYVILYMEQYPKTYKWLVWALGRFMVWPEVILMLIRVSNAWVLRFL